MPSRIGAAVVIAKLCYQKPFHATIGNNRTVSGNTLAPTCENPVFRVVELEAARVYDAAQELTKAAWSSICGPVAFPMEV